MFIYSTHFQLVPFFIADIQAVVTLNFLAI